MILDWLKLVVEQLKTCVGIDFNNQNDLGLTPFACGTVYTCI